MCVLVSRLHPCGLVICLCHAQQRSIATLHNVVRQADGILNKAKATLGLASDKVNEGAAAADGAARTATSKASANYDAAKRSASGAAADASDKAGDAYRATKDAAADTAGSASHEVHSSPSVARSRVCQHACAVMSASQEVLSSPSVDRSRTISMHVQ